MATELGTCFLLCDIFSFEEDIVVLLPQYPFFQERPLLMENIHFVEEVDWGTVLEFE